MANMGDDVSSIYPLDTNECYFQFQDHALVNDKRNLKREESTSGLNDLLDCLNKS
jgi:hypothetical protein